MKTKSNKAARQARFESKLNAYSTASRAATLVAIGAGATGVATDAHGQIVNLTSSSFNQTPTWTVTSLANNASGYVASNHQIQLLPFVMGSLVAHGQWRIQQYNNIKSSTSTVGTNYYYTPTAKSARGEIQLFGSGANPRLFFANAPAGSSLFAQKFAAGQGIKAAGGNWTNSANLLRTSGSTAPSAANFPVGQNAKFGSFAPGSTGYMGFRVRNGTANNLYYGWMRLRFTVDANGRPQTIQLIADGNGVYGAFNSTAYGEITAGATAVPEPANVAVGLALFAFGAVGVREYRRRKQVAA